MDKNIYEIILYDGVCNFCNKWVNFINKNDKKDNFRFLHLQNPKAQSYLKSYNIDLNHGLNSIYIIKKDGKILEKFLASTYAMKKCNYFFYILYFLNYIIPKIILNFFYDLVGKYRYKIFGKTEKCIIPEGVDKKKFLN